MRKTKGIRLRPEQLEYALQHGEVITRFLNRPLTLASQVGQTEVFCYDHEKGTYGVIEHEFPGYEGCMCERGLPYKLGWTVNVREPWRLVFAHTTCYDNGEVVGSSEIVGYGYRDGCRKFFQPIPSDDEIHKTEYRYSEWQDRKKIPPQASLFLRVKDIRVERLQDIPDSELSQYTDCAVNQAFAEQYPSLAVDLRRSVLWPTVWDCALKPEERDIFGWDKNPWTYVVHWEVIKKGEDVNV